MEKTIARMTGSSAAAQKRATAKKRGKSHAEAGRRNIQRERAAEHLRALGIAGERIALLAPGTSDKEAEEAVLHVETDELGHSEWTLP
jgi:hypothetical protein